ncbi:RING-H2 finger protein ATL66-like [Wolffia australiana]
MATQEPSHRFHWHYNELDDKNFQLRGKGNVLVAVVVFAVLLIFVLLCVYVRWTCRYRRQEAVVVASELGSGPGSIRSTLASGGLDRATIDALPVLVVSSPEEAAQCSICLSSMATGQKMKLLPGCNHRFHPDCVDEWLKSQSSCPLCRASPISCSDPSPSPV